MNHQALGENFSMDEYLEASFNLKKETLGLYQKIISEYPDEKVRYKKIYCCNFINLYYYILIKK